MPNLLNLLLYDNIFFYASFTFLQKVKFNISIQSFKYVNGRFSIPSSNHEFFRLPHKATLEIAGHKRNANVNANFINTKSALARASLDSFAEPHSTHYIHSENYNCNNCAIKGDP